jgi:hypothetical protein
MGSSSFDRNGTVGGRGPQPWMMDGAPAGGPQFKLPGAFATTMVTVGAWLGFIFSAMCVECSGFGLCIERSRLYGANFLPFLMRNAPGIHSFAIHHCTVLCCAGFGMFSLSAIAALGVLQRRAWGLHMARGLIVIWLAVFVIQTIIWGGCSLDDRIRPFPLGTVGGIAGLAAIALLALLLLILRSTRISLQFGIEPRPPQQPFMPGIMFFAPPPLQQAPRSRIRPQETQPYYDYGGGPSAGVAPEGRRVRPARSPARWQKTRNP